MDPVPLAATLLPELWPDAGADGNTVLPPTTTAQVLAVFANLANYLEQQHAACAKAAPRAPADR